MSDYKEYFVPPMGKFIVHTGAEEYSGLKAIITADRLPVAYSPFLPVLARSIVLHSCRSWYLWRTRFTITASAKRPGIAIVNVRPLPSS